MIKYAHEIAGLRRKRPIGSDWSLPMSCPRIFVAWWFWRRDKHYAIYAGLPFCL